MNSVPGETSIWTEPLKIRSYDVDFTRRATSASLCRYFLEAAWNHAEALGVGFQHLGRQGKFWVLSRLRIEVRRAPEWGSEARLQTWPRATKALFAMRDFKVTDDTETTLAAGSSAWLVLDATSKRPQRLNVLLAGLAGLDGKAVLGRDPEKLADDQEGDEVFCVKVRYADIDVNRHVNSGRYIEWMLDAYPLEFHRQHLLRVLEINFLSETLEGEVVSVRTWEAGAGAYGHSLRKSGGGEICRARLEWEETRGPKSSA
ncbi:MAG: hypothetical protein KJ072_27630 [Verrucomicrobia bacterium]|nr:hypothetical protein [Verrucomicrobiota bacterium]